MQCGNCLNVWFWLWFQMGLVFTTNELTSNHFLKINFEWQTSVFLYKHQGRGPLWISEDPRNIRGLLWTSGGSLWTSGGPIGTSGGPLGSLGGPLGTSGFPLGTSGFPLGTQGVLWERQGGFEVKFFEVCSTRLILNF